MPSLYYLPVRKRSGLQVVGVGLNVSSRVNVTDRAAAVHEIVSVPDALPVNGGKFPISTRTGTEVYIPYTLTVDGTIISETIEGDTPGDARTNARYQLRDGEPWVLKFRITDSTGAPFGYQAFTECRVTVYDLSTGSADVYTSADPAVAAIVLTALAAWEHDVYGYNVTLTILPAELTGGIEGTHAYKAELNFVLNAGGSRVVNAWLVPSSEMGA